MGLKDAIDRIVSQAQTARERKIFALLHPATGVGRHVGRAVGLPHEPPIGTHGSFAPSRGFAERRFESSHQVDHYHAGFDTAQKTHGGVTDKKKLKLLKSEHNKILFRLDQHREPNEAARYRGFIDGLHRIAGSTPADLSEGHSEPAKPPVPQPIAPPKPVVPEPPKPPAPIDVPSGHEPPAYSNDPALQEIFNQAYAISFGKYADLSVPELERMERRAANGSLDGFRELDGGKGFYQLDVSRRHAASSGAHAAIQEIKRTAPITPIPIEIPPELRPGGSGHARFERERLRGIGRSYLMSLDSLIAERASRMLSLKSELPDDFRRDIIAEVSAIDHVLAHPWVPRSAVPERVVRLKPKEVTQRWGADRWGVNPNSRSNANQYKASYEEAFKKLEQSIASREKFEKSRSYAEIRYVYTPENDINRQIDAHAWLAAHDDFGETVPTFGPKTSLKTVEDARNAAARTAAERVHAQTMAGLEQSVQSAIDNAKHWNVTGPFFVDAVPLQGTSPSTERMSEDLHRLGFYDNIPIYRKDGRNFYGDYSPGLRISTNTIKTVEVYANDENGNNIKDKNGNGKIIKVKNMDQHARTLAHEFGHHYAFSSGNRFESFTNGQRPDVANRDEIVAEAVSHNIGLHYGFDSGGTSYRYIYSSSGNDTALALVKEPKVQEAIISATAQIIADIERSRVGVTDIDHGGGFVSPISAFHEYTPARLGVSPARGGPAPTYLGGAALMTATGGMPRERMRETLTRGAISDVTPLSSLLGGVNSSYSGRAVHEGASVPVFVKPTDNYLSNASYIRADIEANNLAAQEINRALGDLVIMPETVSRSVMVPDPAITAREYQALSLNERRASSLEMGSLVSNWIQHSDRPDMFSPEYPDLTRDIALFDVVTANKDRNLGNYLLVSPPGEAPFMAAIDHDLILRPTAWIPPGPMTVHAGEPLPQRQLNALNALMSQRLQLDQRLEELGITDQQRTELFQRVSWLLLNMRFPSMLEWPMDLTVTQEQSPHERAMFAVLHPATGVGHHVGDPVRAQRTLRDLLQTGRIERVTPNHSSGVNSSYHGVIPLLNGAEIRVAIKPSRNTLSTISDIEANNLAAQEINRALGGLVAIPETVSRSVEINHAKRESLVSPWAPYTQTARMVGGHEKNSPVHPLSRDIALFDVVTANNDRNGGNYLYVTPPEGDPYLVAIDHDLVFSGNISMVVKGPSQEHQGEPLQEHQIAALTALKRNAGKLRAALAPFGIRSDRVERMFDRVDWLLANRRLPSYTDSLSSGSPSPGAARRPKIDPLGTNTRKMLDLLGFSPVTQEQSAHDRAMFAHLHPGSGLHHGVGSPVGRPVEGARQTLRNMLRQGTVSGLRKLDHIEGGVNATYVGTLTHEGHSIKIKLKPVENTLSSEERDLRANNLAAGIINEALGGIVAMPETVTRMTPITRKVGSWEREQRVFHEVTNNTETLIEPWFEHAHPVTNDEHVKHLTAGLALFDVVTGNADRNPSNYLEIRPPGESPYILAIDHDMVLDDNFNGESFDLWGPARNHQWGILKPEHLDALHQLVARFEPLRQSLRLAGIKDRQIAQLRQRVDWLIQNRRFPHDGEEYDHVPAVV